MSYDGLSDDKLLKLLETEEDRLPRAAVDEILRRPHLGARLIALMTNEKLWEEEGEPLGWAPVHATFIVARMKPPGALDAVMKAIEIADEWGADTLWDDTVDMVASFGVEAVPRLLEDIPGAGTLIRVDLIEAIGLIARAHPSVRPRVMEALRELMKDDEGAQTVAWALLDIAPEDPETRDALKQRGIDVDRVKAIPPREPMDWLRRYDPEAIERRRRGEDDVRPEADDDDEEIFDEGSGAADLHDMVGPPSVLDSGVEADGPGTLERTGPKVGRNDPCPCGSGKKYKKCCGG
jgi:hypothetical protein